MANAVKFVARADKGGDKDFDKGEFSISRKCPNSRGTPLHAGGVLANSQGLSAKRDTPGLRAHPMTDPSGVADRVAVA